MTIYLRTNRLVGALMLCAAIGMISFCGVLIWKSIIGDYSLLSLIIGAVTFPMVTVMSISIIEDMSVALDRHGIEQRRVFCKGYFLKKRRIAWGDVDSFSSKGLLYKFKSAEYEVCVNIALFNDGDEFIRYIEAHLPPDKFEVPPPQILVPSRKIVVGAWTCVLTAILGGAWFSFDGRALAGSSYAWAWGCAIVVAAIVWAGRIIESSSVVLDRDGLDQIKLFHGGRILARHRLTWQSVNKTSSFLSIVKVRGSGLCIRVDARYFDETEEVQSYLHTHIKEALNKVNDV